MGLAIASVLTSCREPSSRSGRPDSPGWVPAGVLSELSSCSGGTVAQADVLELRRFNDGDIAVSFWDADHVFNAAFLEWQERSSWRCKDLQTGPDGNTEPFPTEFIAQLSLDTDGDSIIPVIVGQGIDKIVVTTSSAEVGQSYRPQEGTSLLVGTPGDQIRLYSGKDLVLGTPVAPADLEFEPFNGATQADESLVGAFLAAVEASDTEEASRFVASGVAADTFVDGLHRLLLAQGIRRFSTPNPTFFGFEVEAAGDGSRWDLFLVMVRADRTAVVAHYELRRRSQPPEAAS